MKNEIELNGKKYVLKNEILKSNINVEDKFTLKQEIELNQKFIKIFPQSEIVILDEQILLKENVYVMSPCNVLMVSSNTTKGKLFLKNYVQEYELNKKMFNLDYKIKDVETEITSKFTLSYLFKIFDILKVVQKFEKKESIKLKLNQDYPMTIETKNFKFVLAPRIETD